MLHKAHGQSPSLVFPARQRARQDKGLRFEVLRQRDGIARGFRGARCGVRTHEARAVTDKDDATFEHLLIQQGPGVAKVHFLAK